MIVGPVCIFIIVQDIFNFKQELGKIIDTRKNQRAIQSLI